MKCVKVTSVNLQAGRKPNIDKGQGTVCLILSVFINPHHVVPTTFFDQIALDH